MTSTTARTATTSTMTAARILLASLDGRGLPLVVQQQLRPTLIVATILDAEAAGLLTAARDGARDVLRRTEKTTSDDLLAAVVAGCDGRSVASAINRLAISTWSGGAVEIRLPLLERLAAEGVARRVEGRVLTRQRWIIDPDAQRAAVAPFRAALAGESEACAIDDDDQRLLASAAVSAQLTHRIVRTNADGGATPRQVRRRAARILEREPIALAGHRALAAAMAA